MKKLRTGMVITAILTMALSILIAACGGTPQQLQSCGQYTNNGIAENAYSYDCSAASPILDQLQTGKKPAGWDCLYTPAGPDSHKGECDGPDGAVIVFTDANSTATPTIGFPDTPTPKPSATP